MNWKQLLSAELEYLYRVSEGLFEKVDNDELAWKPATGENWMTTGQLLLHIATGNGPGFKGFVTGDWGMPPEGELSEEDMLPSADKLPTAASIAEVKRLLDEDKALALEMLAQCSEQDLSTKQVTAPWNPDNPMGLGYRLLQMVTHLASHKAQLFYYLKLQGKAVHTGHLWG